MIKNIYYILILTLLFFVSENNLPAKTNIKPAVMTNADSKEKKLEKIKEENNQKIEDETLDFWKETFKYGTAEQKMDIISTIRRQKIEKGEKLILDNIKDEKSMKIRQNMISALVEFSNRAAIPHIMPMTTQSNKDEDKIFALSKIKELKHKGANKEVAAMLDSENTMLVESALRTLGALEAKEVVDQLIQRLEEEKSDRLKTQIILTLANIKSEKSFETMLSIFTNDEEGEFNRAYAATGIGYIKKPASYKILIDSYEEANPNIKMRILDALGNQGNTKAIPLIKESLKDNEENVRYYGILALGKLKATSATQILKFKKKHDPSAKVRKEATKVLEQLAGVK
jgi:HEAT repeat protein